MNWDLYPAREGFSQFKADWDALNQFLHRNHPLFDSCFVEPLIAHFAGEKDRLAICRDRVGRRSMLLLTERGAFSWGAFSPSQSEISPVMVACPTHVHSLLRSLPGPVLWLDLWRQDPQYSIAIELANRADCESRPRSLTVNIAVAGDFGTYWRGRSAKLRQEIRRMLRRVEEDGMSHRLEIQSSLTNVQEAVVRYGEMESKSWKATGGTAIHSENKQGKFYLEMMLNFAAKNDGQVYELYFDGELAASQLTIGNDRMLITLKTTYEPSYARYSPGRVLDYLMLEREFALKRYSIIEFYTNAGVDTLRWATGEREISNIRAYRFPWLLTCIGVWRGIKSRQSSRDTTTDCT